MVVRHYQWTNIAKIGSPFAAFSIWTLYFLDGK